MTLHVMAAKPKQKDRAKPIKVQVGNAVVKIYRTKSRGYPVFQVSDYSEGKRKLISYAEEQEARDKATQIATKLANSEGAVLRLTAEDCSTYLRALDLLKATGVPLELAAAQFADAHQRLGGRSIREAVDFFVRRNPGNLPRKTVTEAFNEMIAAKKADGASAVYIKDLNFRVGKFAGDFQCQLSDMTEAQVNEWLRSLKCGARARNNYRLSVCTLFRYAESVGHLTREHIDFKRITKATEAQTEIEIFTPQEIGKLIEAATLNAETLRPGVNRRYASGQGLLPLLVLGAFAGLRTAEIMRQKWSDINTERGFIRVTAAKGNTAQKRLVPISDNLKQWLTACTRDGELCCDYGRVEDAIQRLATRAGVTWKHNALRHSFISYRVAQTQNIPQTALEAGNSPAMINRHYRELVTPEEAKVWFAIKPVPVALQ